MNEQTNYVYHLLLDTLVKLELTVPESELPALIAKLRGSGLRSGIQDQVVALVEQSVRYGT